MSGRTAQNSGESSSKAREEVIALLASAGVGDEENG
jgi:hypothetical protein